MSTIRVLSVIVAAVRLSMVTAARADETLVASAGATNSTSVQQATTGAAAPETALAKSDLGQAGDWALGFQSNFFPIGANGAAVDSFPTITVRHWFDRSPGKFAKAWGLDVGFGFNLDAGTGGTNFGFGLLGGVPLAVAVFQHAAFVLEPGASIALLHVGINNQDATFFNFGLAARAGFEVFFGFIGIPQLSLDAGITAGLALSTRPNVTRFVLGASVGNNPWDIFRANVAARYYF